jgi:hypothetical protein
LWLVWRKPVGVRRLDQRFLVVCAGVRYELAEGLAKKAERADLVQLALLANEAMAIVRQKAEQTALEDMARTIRAELADALAKPPGAQYASPRMVQILRDGVPYHMVPFGHPYHHEALTGKHGLSVKEL